MLREHMSVARDFLKRSLEIFTAHYGPDHWRCHAVCFSLSICEMVLRVEGEPDIFDKSFETTDEVADDRRGDTNNTQSNNNHQGPEKWHLENPGQAIRQAAATGTLEELNSILQKYPQFSNRPDLTPGKGFTAMHWAVKKKRTQHVEALLNVIGYTEQPDVRGLTALDNAIRDNLTDIIIVFKKALIKYYSQYKLDDTQLPKLARVCAKFGNISGLKLLIHLSVSIDEPGPESGKTALHFAVINGHDECVRLLKEAGANSNLKDNEGNTPESLARNNPKISKILDSYDNNCFKKMMRSCSCQIR